MIRERHSKMLDWLIEQCSQETDECIEWPGASCNGYPSITLGRVRQGAHRISAHLFVGDVQPGDVVMHSCDNPICVNPDHLSIGTHQENVDDMRSKGRGSYLYGQDHSQAKLSDEEVDEIRRQYATGCFTQRELANTYDVHQGHVSRLVRREVRPSTGP